VRRIVAEHGGSIEVADNTPRGTRFTIELPA
jgi:signal transduction histidine kinase